MDFQILAYDQGPSIIAEGISPELLQSDISVSIGAILKYKEDNNLIGAQINVQISAEAKQLMLFGLILTIRVINWIDMINQKSDDEIKLMLTPIWDAALGFVRGVMAEQSKNSVLREVFLPIINIDEFSKTVVLEKIVE